MMNLSTKTGSGDVRLSLHFKVVTYHTWPYAFPSPNESALRSDRTDHLLER